MAKRKRNNNLIFILIGAIVLLGALGYWKQQSRPKGEKITTEKVEPRTIKEMVAASGKVFPQTEVKISSDVSGEIVELYVEEGDSVEVGQILAKIDPDAYQSQVERGVASVNGPEVLERCEPAKTPLQGEKWMVCSLPFLLLMRLQQS